MNSKNILGRLSPPRLLPGLAAALFLPLLTQAQPGPDQPAAMPPPPGVQAAPRGKSPSPARAQAATPVCSEFGSSAQLSLPEHKSLQLDLAKLNLPSPAWLRTLPIPM